MCYIGLDLSRDASEGKRTLLVEPPILKSAEQQCSELRQMVTTIVETIVVLKGRVTELEQSLANGSFDLPDNWREE